MNKPFATTFVFAIFTICTTAFAQDLKTFVDPDKTDKDFQFQGEYSGDLSHDGNSSKVGLQIIALGNGKFRAVCFIGGLPGDGGDGENREVIEVEGIYDDDSKSVIFKGAKRGDAVIKDGVLTASSADGKHLGQLKKVQRKSKTLGQQAPAGAIVLFDGKNADQWENGQVTDDGLLKEGTTSKKRFGDHKIHIEFRLPYMPTANGQQRGNSGIYVQGRYEVQMLDSFGLEGKNNECGGIYSVADPELNMCYPPLSWQTYDIEFTAAKFDAQNNVTNNARMTVYHNGVKIHDDVELPARVTTAAPNPFDGGNGPVYLQDHGNDVRYRNIWVQEIDQ
jgi:hypothetical protein